MLLDASGRKLSLGMGVQISESRCPACPGEGSLACSFWACADSTYFGRLGHIVELDRADFSAKIAFLDHDDEPEEGWPWFHIFKFERPSPASLESSVLLDLNEKLFGDDSFKDVTFKLADGEVAAHKSVLAASSLVFASMFRSRRKDATTDVVAIPGITVVVMRVFLRLLYTNTLEPSDWSKDYPEEQHVLPTEILQGVAAMAKKYMVERIAVSVTEAFKSRLRKSNGNSEVFEEILAAAAATNLDTVGLVALNAAENHYEVHEAFDKSRLRPEVQTELRMLWPFPQQQKKRMRLS